MVWSSPAIRRYTSLAAALCCLLWGLVAPAQEVPSAFRSWSKLGLEGNLPHGASFSAHQLFRTLTGGIPNRTISEGTLSVPVGTWEAEVELRYYWLGQTVAEWGEDQRGRVRINVERSWDLGNRSLSSRFGVQHRVAVVGTSPQKTDLRWRMRLAQPSHYPRMLYDVEWLGQPHGSRVQRLRGGASLRWGQSGPWQVETGYFYERNLNQTGPHFHTVTFFVTRKGE